MNRSKKYLRPVVLREMPTIDLPELTDITISEQFKTGGVKKYNTGGENEGPDIDQQWEEFLTKYPDYTWGTTENQFIRDHSGRFIINPNFLPEVTVPSNTEGFDFEASLKESKDKLQNQLNELNKFDQKWKLQGEYYGANRGPGTNNKYAYAKLIGPYSLPKQIDHRMRNEMPTWHPNYNQEVLDWHNKDYDKWLEETYQNRINSERGVMDMSRAFGNTIYGIGDLVLGTPKRGVTWGLNKMFGDGSKEVDMTPLIIRENSFDAQGNLTDFNPTSAEVLPGYENRNQFANTLINLSTDPLTYVGGWGASRTLPMNINRTIRTGIANTPKNLTNTLINTGKSNLKGIQKGYKQIVGKDPSTAYFSPWKSRVAGSGNIAYYTSKQFALPGAVYSVGDFSNKALFSKEGATWDDALNTTFDFADARLPFSGTVRDLWKGSVRAYQDKDIFSENAIPYYFSGLSKNPLINASAKGWRTGVSWLGDPFSDKSATRYQYGNLQNTDNPIFDNYNLNSLDTNLNNNNLYIPPSEQSINPYFQTTYPHLSIDYSTESGG